MNKNWEEASEANSIRIINSFDPQPGRILLKPFIVCKKIAYSPNTPPPKLNHREIAYALAKELLANGCIFSSERRRAINCDEYQFNIYVMSYQKKMSLP